MKESKPETALMRKTKKELIDIILRKDDVELRLKSNVDNLKEEVDQLNNRIVGYESDINGLHASLDEQVSLVCELRENLHKCRTKIRYWQIATIILAVVAILVIAL